MATSSKLEEITKLIWTNSSKMANLSDTWNDYDNSLVTKSDSELTWYDKATLNLNPNLKDRRVSYQSLVTQNNDLSNQLVNLQSAQDYLQQSIDEQKTSANRLYDLQNAAARLSAEINWWANHAWWLWAWAWQMAQSRAAIDNQAFANILQNEQNRAATLNNIAAQQANLPQTLASIWQANSQNAYYNSMVNQNSWWTSSSWSRWTAWWWSSSGWWSNSKKENSDSESSESSDKDKWPLLPDTKQSVTPDMSMNYTKQNTTKKDFNNMARDLFSYTVKDIDPKDYDMWMNLYDNNNLRSFDWWRAVMTNPLAWKDILINYNAWLEELKKMYNVK